MSKNVRNLNHFWGTTAKIVCFGDYFDQTHNFNFDKIAVKGLVDPYSTYQQKQECLIKTLKSAIFD